MESLIVRRSIMPSTIERPSGEIRQVPAVAIGRTGLVIFRGDVPVGFRFECYPDGGRTVWMQSAANLWQLPVTGTDENGNPFTINPN